MSKRVIVLISILTVAYILSGFVDAGVGFDTPGYRRMNVSISLGALDVTYGYLRWSPGVWFESHWDDFALDLIPTADVPGRDWTGAVIRIPLYFIFILVFIAIPKRFRRLHGSRCANCNYDLRANTTGVCPECGTPHEVATIELTQG